MAGRIPPLSLDDMSNEQRTLIGPWSSMNFASVIVQHPELYKVLLPLIAKVIPSSNLPPRDREILVLRTLALCNETYEAHHHATIAQKSGMRDADIDAAKTGGTDLSPFEQCLVKAADELAADKRVSVPTWQELAKRYSPIQLMEVVALVGTYTLMAMLTKSYGIEVEDPQTLGSFAALRTYT